MKNLATLLMMVMLVSALGCQPVNSPAPIRPPGPVPTKIVVTATPDIPATVTALANLRSAGSPPGPTALPTPDLEATIEARIAATLEAMSNGNMAPTEKAPTMASTVTIPTANTVSLPLLKFDKDFLLFGPKVGRVRPQDWDKNIVVFLGPTVRQDVLVEASFQVPETTAGKHWEHGFLLKYSGENNHHRVSLQSSGDWIHFYRLGDSEKLGEKVQRTPDLNLEPGDTNLFQVALVEDQALVYINGKYQGTTSLREDTRGSQVALFLDDEAEGRNSFVGFSVWKWAPGISNHFAETVRVAGSTPSSSTQSGSTPALPTIFPTIVPVETASKVARTIETSKGRRVDVTVEGFVDNRHRFDQLVQVINEEEQLLGVPYPAPRVNMRRVSKLPAGFCGHNQMSYEARYQGDPYTVEASVIRLRVAGNCDDTLGSIAHEVAHTWFHGNDPADWIDEGLDNTIEYKVKEAHPQGAEEYPPVTYCASYRNIGELERAAPQEDLSVEASGFRCNYRLGDGIFGALTEYHGSEEFNRHIAKLARRSVNTSKKAHSIEDVREVLGSDGKSLEIIDLWYRGEPDMKIYRHLDLVSYTHPPTIDGEYFHFAGRTEELGLVHDFNLGDDPFCSQFFVFEGLADPEPLSGIADPLAVGWHHNEVPEVVAINSEINAATGEFSVTARVNSRETLMAEDLSLQVSSQVPTGPDGKCEESTNFSQVQIVHGTIADELRML